MRLIVAGAQVTDAMVEILDDLQNTPVGEGYADVIDEACRFIILSDYPDGETAIGLLRELVLLRKAVATLASPPDADLPQNDIPLIEI